MHIINPETIPKNNIYTCNKQIARWLIYKKHLSLFGRNGKIWYFAKTEELESALKELPFLLSIVSKF